MARAVRIAGVSGLLVVCASFGACGGNEFDSAASDAGAGGESTEPGTTAGSHADAGTPPANEGGGSNVSGAGNSSGDGNAGGAGAEPPGKVCAPPATLANLAELRFGEPEPLEAINESANLENLRFARVAPFGSALTYTRDFFDSHIWVTLDPADGPGAAVAPPLAADGLFESAALVLPDTPGGALGGFNIFFQRTVAKDSMQLELFGGRWSLTGSVMDVARLPSPFNPPPATVPWAYGLAIGNDRVVWTVNTDGMLGTGLRTSSLNDAAEAQALEVSLPSGCAAREIDFAPWLTLDGKTLLFTARRRDAMCEILPGDETAIFAVNLGDDGQPLGSSVELEGLAGANPPEGARFTDGSLSPDHCFLYYSALTKEQPHLRLFRAPRVLDP